MIIYFKDIGKYLFSVKGRGVLTRLKLVVNNGKRDMPRGM
jgi:hypothetical protein